MYDNDVFKYPYHKNNYSFEIEVSIPKATIRDWKNNCFSIYTRSDLNRVRKKTIERQLVWLTGLFIPENVAIHQIWAYTVDAQTSDFYSIFKRGKSYF